MMKVKKTNPVQKAKVAFVLPLAAVAVAAFASERVENISDKVEHESEALVQRGENSVAKIAGETLADAPVAASIQMVKAESEIPVAADTVRVDKETKGSKGFGCVAETFPEFPGGQSALFKYLAENVKFPKSEQAKDVDARVITTFTVEKDGSITGAKIAKSQGEAFDQEALRVINAMPKWVPGTRNGKAVSVKYTMPIRFRTDGDGKKIKSVRTIDLSGNADKMPKGKIVSQKMEMFSNKDFVVVLNGKVTENLNGIKPDDIEKIDVKKDAETIKKYNAEGKQGVMLITTK